MKKSSWIVLIVCAALLGLLGFVYVQSQKPAPELTEARIELMLDQMKDAVRHKDVRKLMSYVDSNPETRIAHLNLDQLRLLLSRSFKQSIELDPNYTNLTMHHEGPDCTIDFDLAVLQKMPEGTGDDYQGHITLLMQRVEVGHMLGLYHTQEWKIVRAESSGPDLTNYGDY